VGPVWTTLLGALLSFAVLVPDVGTIERIIAGFALIFLALKARHRRMLLGAGLVLGILGALRIDAELERAREWSDVGTACLVSFVAARDDDVWDVRLGHPETGVVDARLRKAPSDARVGDLWRLRVETSPLPRKRNPDDRRALRAALARGGVIRAKGTDAGVRIDRGGGPGRVQRLRDDVGARWEAVLGGTAGLWRALLLADRDGLHREATVRVQRLGFAHLLALSGLHVGIVVGLLAWSVGRRSRSGMLAVLPLLAVWALLAGGGVSMVRAVLMVVGVVIGRHVRRHVRLTEILAVCALVEIAIRPEVIGGIGWWLSYAATLAILRGLPLLRGRHPILQGLGVSLIAQAGTLPWILDAFGRLPLLAPVVLLVVGPLFSLVLAVGGVAAVAALAGVPAAAGVAGISAHVFGGSLALVEVTGDIAWWHPGIDDVGWAFMMILSGIWLVPARDARWRLRVVCSLLVVVGLHLPSFRTSPWIGGTRHEWISFDIGQGDAGLYRCGSAIWVVDTGPGSGDWRPIERSVVPYVERRGLRDLRVVLTHRHGDHVAGTRRLLRTGRVGSLVLARCDREQDWAREFAALADSMQADVRWVARGDTLHHGCCDVRVLWPPDDSALVETLHETNDHSVVLAVGPAEAPLLATGDLERRGERGILEELRGTEPGWILKIAHHGGDTGTDSELLGVLRPTWGLISCGHGNGYGHPKPAVLERLEEAGVRVLRTDRVGAITVRWDRNGPRVETAGGRP